MQIGANGRVPEVSRDWFPSGTPVPLTR